MSIFGPIPILSEKDALAPIAKQLAAFEEHKRDLLDTLQKGHKIGQQSIPLDADKSWEDIIHLARHYFWGRVMEQDARSNRQSIKQLQGLSKALRKANGLTQRAIRDGVADELFKAWFVQKNISLISAVDIDLATPIDKDGSSFLTRIADDIKEMMETLATLAALSHTAASIADVSFKGGRPPLLARACIQGLARVYRSSTGLKPGRGDGPFADFAYEFMTAVGQTGFEYESLTDAIQEAHRQFTPSWFDEQI
jgi:hypothetical protein